ncbi:hypothetical protein F0562_010028 [Nyssa sinensis]|uniref:Zinc finger PHD-type domain-containing protein n=1 Tax=Nyssa sinensis TaxID=561372 RepID=A0A5J4ZXR0_9ASTE|nr:hypothetical protein F0562_010028 [Nyssa sinensis]
MMRGESLADTVSNYYFVDDKDELISFSELPVQWNESESPEGKGKQIFLHGTADNGLQKICKQVTAWKFDLADAKPEILVLSKENIWIKLQKPRKFYEDTIRTILITLHCLHLVKKNPETSGKSLWDHLAKVFSLYEVRPSENDIVDHVTLIGEAVKWDETLAKSKLLVTFLEEKPRKRKAIEEDVRAEAKSGFIVDDDMIVEAEEDESDEESDLYDHVCSICDNGGSVLSCEGRCMRLFHATVEAGSESKRIQNFFCKNCQYKQHQCFSCGLLGSSDKNSGAEVFSCVSATCGHFYHPHCVAKLLHRESETEAEELQKNIAAGESFTCPVHKCHVCKQGENKMDPELQFAICRRCPKSYHRKCLPRKIAFDDLEDEGIIQRAWEGLLPNRILIYCLKHAIDDDLRIPIRNHIKFPKIGEEKKKRASDLPSSGEKVVQRKRSLASEDFFGKRTAGKALKGFEKLPSVIKEGNSPKNIEKRSSGPVLSEEVESSGYVWQASEEECFYESGVLFSGTLIQDKSLSTGLFFLELLSAVEPRVVNWNLVNQKMILTLTASVMYWCLQQPVEESESSPSPATGTTPDASPAPSINGEDDASLSVEVSNLTIDDAASDTTVSSQFPKPQITGRTKTKRRPFLGQELGFRLSSLQLSGHFFGGCHSGC